MFAPESTGLAPVEDSEGHGSWESLKKRLGPQVAKTKTEIPGPLVLHSYPEQLHLQLDSSLGGMSPGTLQPREARAWHREPHSPKGGTQEQLLSLLGALGASAHP